MANLNLQSASTDAAEQLKHETKVRDLLLKAKRGAFRSANFVEPLLELSKCPDFVVNRGHYFGTTYFKEEPGLSDDDKRALIEFLRTF